MKPYPRYGSVLLAVTAMTAVMAGVLPVAVADDPVAQGRFEQVAQLTGVSDPMKAVFMNTASGVPDIVFANTSSHCIKTWSPSSSSGETVTIVGTCDEQGSITDDNPANTLLDTPVSVIVMGDGLVIADTGNSRLLYVVNDVLQVLEPIDPETRLPVSIVSPLDLAGRGQTLYIADGASHRVWEMDMATGDTVSLLGTGEAGYREDSIDAEDQPLNRPCGLDIYTASGFDDYLYVLEAGNRIVRELSPEKTTLRPRVGDPWSEPQQWPPMSTPAALIAFIRPFRISINYNLTSMIITDPAANRLWNRSAEGFIAPLELPGVDADETTYSARWDAGGEYLVTTHPGRMVVWRLVMP